MRKTYKYVIELSKPVWPRHLVDELIYKTGKVRDAEVISVKDLQYDKHLYGDTYYVKKPYDQKALQALQALRERGCLLTWLNEDDDE